MKNRRTLLALVLALGLVQPASLLGAALDDGKGAPTIEDLGFLAGTWSGDAWGGKFIAYYTTPEGGSVISHSKLMRGDEEAFYEFELFEVRDDVVHLQPFPGGQRATGSRRQARRRRGAGATRAEGWTATLQRTLRDVGLLPQSRGDG